MTEPCARPGCGHDHLEDMYHEGSVGPFVECPLAPEVYGGCPCPAYRTQAQQEAWEALAKVNQQHHFPPWTVIERLLELYP